MSKALAIGLFLGLLIVGIAFGVARDLYSRERGLVKGVIVEIDPGGKDFKSSIVRPAKLKARLEDGRTVDISVTQTSDLRNGQPITATELVMPWGQVWYKLNSQ